MVVRFRNYFSALLVLALLVGGPSVAAAQESRPNTTTIAGKIVELTNQARREKGLKELLTVTYLEQAARGHSKEMIELNYFSHVSPTPGRTDTKQRIHLARGWDTRFGENIYRTQGVSADELADRAVKAWLASPSHCANLMEPTFNSVGIGIFPSGDEFAITQLFSTQTIVIDKLVSKPASGGYEFVFKGRVREGSKEGAMFINNQFKSKFQADANGVFELKGVAPAGAQVSMSQKKPDNKYAQNLSFPADAEAP